MILRAYQDSCINEAVPWSMAIGFLLHYITNPCLRANEAGFIRHHCDGVADRIRWGPEPINISQPNNRGKIRLC